MTELLVRMATPRENTCTVCGQPLGETCWARDEQAAIAGLAWCESCAAARAGQASDEEAAAPAKPRRQAARAQ